MVTSTGKPVTHAQLLQELLNAVKLPKRLAVRKCAAHTNKTDEVLRENAYADKKAKEAAEGKIEALLTEDSNEVTNKVLQEMQQQSPEQEKRLWTEKGATIKDGIYTCPQNKPILPKNLFKWAAKFSHGKTHASTGGWWARYIRYTQPTDSISIQKIL